MSKIRILQGYDRQTDGKFVAGAGAVIKGLTGGGDFPELPGEVSAAEAALDAVNAAIAAQPHGGAAATAIKKNKRAQLEAIMTRIAHHVEDNCGGDLAKVLNAGFTVAASSRVGAPVEKPSIAAVDFGNTTQLIVKVNPNPHARCFELRKTAVGAGDAPGPWESVGFFTNSRAMIVSGLTPLATYSFQVRAIGRSGGLTDWSDPASHVCL